MRLFIITLALVLLSACSSDEGGGTPASTTAAPEPAKANQESSGTTMSGGIMIVDHSTDEKEFRKKRALAGVDRLIEQYKAAGYDTAELEARKKELQAQ